MNRRFAYRAGTPRGAGRHRLAATGAGKLRVKDVYAPSHMLSLVVPENTPIQEVIRRFAEQPELRGIFVVDSAKRLTGVITRTDLLAWASIAFGPPGLQSRFSFRRLVQLANATTAKEACHPHSHLAAVSPNDGLDEALGRMVAHDLIDVPVVDAKGKILGDLRLTQILAKTLETRHGAHGRAGG